MIKLQKVSNREYCLLEDYTVYVKNYKITVKEGFIFDGASLPRVTWSLIGCPFIGAYTIPALIHDALYASEIVSRQEADSIFLALLEEYGVSYLKRYSMYWGVRAGGGLVWLKHTAETVNESKKYITIETL